MKRLNDSPFVAALIAPTPPRATLRRVAFASWTAFPDAPVRRAYVTIKWPSGIIQTWPGAVAAYTAEAGVTEIVADSGMIFSLDPAIGEKSINEFHVIKELVSEP